MTETFDTFTSRPRIYYILLCLSILTFSFLLFAKFTDLDLPQKYMPYVIIIVILGIIAILSFVILTVFGRMYIIDGELILSSEFVTINLITISLGEVKRIDIKANDYKGARSSDGSGNRIEIHINNNVYSCRFVINSKSQRDNLKQLTKDWQANGVNIETLAF
jgi:hypothetical protein